MRQSVCCAEGLVFHVHTSESTRAEVLSFGLTRSELVFFGISRCTTGVRNTGAMEVRAVSCTTYFFEKLLCVAITDVENVLELILRCERILYVMR